MMNIVFVIVLALWIYILTVLKRGKLDFWYFITGSIGLFVFMLIKVEPVVLAPLQKSVSAVAGMFGDMTGIYEGYFNKNIVFIATGDANLSMYIDYECSGIVEMLAFLSLLWFFPMYHTYETICLIVHVFGGGSYFVAHSIIGRLVFYACTVLLYFFVFTKAQIIRQKVGGFRYDTDNTDLS